MPDSVSTCSAPLLSKHLDFLDEGDLWAVILASAGGDSGAPDPISGYVTPLGARSMFRQALERIAPLVTPQRTVVVTLEGQSRGLAADLRAMPGFQLLPQPVDRGTAASVLLAAHWIGARDPRATVVVFPVDHPLLEDAVLMWHGASVAKYARAHPDQLVLMGAPATEPDAGYGWIEPGERVGSTGRAPVHRIRGFWEKPSDELAHRLFTQGCLWNTFVFATSVAVLIQAGRQCLPLLHDRLVRLGLFLGTQYESWALRQAYLFAPRADFSRSILESCLPSLAVAQVPPLIWCDLGHPERVPRGFLRPRSPLCWPDTLRPSA
ncbi:MAG TPA: sugar phosphate nucleotidyltransferase [Candidatus Methylomirabilis sp.]|nr:sugar phosphate nucleotidyltransferase [Candidatus Methylomirabilis sp.]